MKIADYLLCEPDLQWKYAAQMGVKYAVGRMPEGHMDETAASFERLSEMQKRYEDAGLKLVAIEPAPLNQKIKLNLPGRDEEVENMCSLIKNMGMLGIEVLCYNFAAYFNWVRTSYSILERGGALVTGYNHNDLNQNHITEYGVVTHEELWKNFEYLQRAIVPVAEKAGVRLALHPDDPPVSSIQGIGRILTSADAMEKAINIVPSRVNGITMCQGTFCAMGEDIIDCIKRFGSKDKINLVHFRDIRGTKQCFHETFHDNGMTDMAACIRVYNEVGFDGYARVDHVPTMTGEENEKPGYGTLGRLFAVGYIKGLCDMGRLV